MWPLPLVSDHFITEISKLVLILAPTSCAIVHSKKIAQRQTNIGYVNIHTFRLFSDAVSIAVDWIQQ